MFIVGNDYKVDENMGGMGRLRRTRDIGWSTEVSRCLAFDLVQVGRRRGVFGFFYWVSRLIHANTLASLSYKMDP
jgi:hypothetical protein